MVKVLFESAESVLTEYEEEVKRLIGELQVEQGIFGDSSMRYVCLL